MPFDSRTADEVVTLPPFARGRQGLRNLAYVLRNPVLWPQGHEWDYSTVLSNAPCGTAGCAIGIARMVWPGFPLPLEHQADWCPQAASFFGMKQRTFEEIFISARKHDCDDWEEVTPVMVADAIDSYLAQHAG